MALWGSMATRLLPASLEQLLSRSARDCPDLKPVADQPVADEEVVPGPPAGLQWPPEAEGSGPPTTRTVARWMKWLVGAGILIVVVALAGTFIRIPYDTLAPGGTLSVEPRITVHGAKTYPSRGELMLLYVRERTHINLWSWLQAKLDPEIDLVKQSDITGGTSQHFNDLQAVCDMSQSQVDAEVAALRTLGYDVKTMPGLAVVGILKDYSYETSSGVVNTIPLPAYNVLQPCDEVLAADGHAIKKPDDLSKIVKGHEPGSQVSLRIDRDGKQQTVQVPVAKVPGDRLIGVDLGLRYDLPVQISVDTSDISGPSGGLAMALAIIDDLTPGDLTGGKKVAVTGTIDSRRQRRADRRDRAEGDRGASRRRAGLHRPRSARTAPIARARPTSRPRRSASATTSSSLRCRHWPRR